MKRIRVANTSLSEQVGMGLAMRGMRKPLIINALWGPPPKPLNINMLYKLRPYYNSQMLSRKIA